MTCDKNNPDLDLDLDLDDHVLKDFTASQFTFDPRAYPLFLHSFNPHHSASFSMKQAMDEYRTLLRDTNEHGFKEPFAMLPSGATPGELCLMVVRNSDISFFNTGNESTILPTSSTSQEYHEEQEQEDEEENEDQKITTETETESEKKNKINNNGHQTKKPNTYDETKYQYMIQCLVYHFDRHMHMNIYKIPNALMVLKKYVSPYLLFSSHLEKKLLGALKAFLGECNLKYKKYTAPLHQVVNDSLHQIKEIQDKNQDETTTITITTNADRDVNMS